MSAMKKPTEFRAGVARRDVSPERPELLIPTGMSRLHPTRGVLDPICVEALAIEAGGELAFVTTSDLRYIEPGWAREIRETVAARTGCDPHRVLQSSNHNHCSSPEAAKDSFLPLQGRDLETVKAEARAAAIAAKRKIVDGFIEACVEAHAKLRPAEIAFRAAKLKEPMGENRRTQLSNGTAVNCWGTGMIAPPGLKLVGPAGPFDPVVYMVAIREVGADRPFALLTNYNSHPHLGPVPWFSGESAGACKRAVEARLPGTITLYAHGTGGNIDLHCMHPIPADGEAAELQWFKDSTAELGRRFADAVVPAAQKPMRYSRPKRMACAYYSEGEEGEDQGRPVVILNTLVLGKVAFVTLPGELFVEFGLDLCRRSPVPHVLLMGYNGSQSGYIGPDLAFEQGAYELMQGPGQPPSDPPPDPSKIIQQVLANGRRGRVIVDKILEMLQGTA